MPMLNQTNTRITLRADNWQFEASAERVTMRGTLCAAGSIRNAVNKETRMRVQWEVLKAAFEQGLFNNLACFLDHEGPYNDNVRMGRIVGVWGEPVLNEALQRVEATLYFYANQVGQEAYTTLQNMAEDADAGRPVPDVGVSIDFFGKFEAVEDDYALTQIAHIRSADLVFMPALADSRIHGAFSATYQLLEDEIMPQATAPTVAHEDEPVEGVLEITLEAQPEAVQFDVEQANSALQRLEAAERRLLQREIQHAIVSSGLPQPVITTLRQRTFASVESAEQAISDAQAIWAAAVEDGVVQMGGGTGRRDVQMTHPLDEAANIMNWLFGVPDAETPEFEMRRLSSFYRAMTGDLEVIGRENPEHIRFAGANTTELANLAEDALNKVLIMQWDGLGMYRWYEFITSVLPNDGSLHDIKMSQIASTGSMPTVAEGGAYTEGTLDDTKETASFTNKGKFIGITRHMVKQDDLVGLRQIPELIAQDAVFERSSAVAAIFTTGAGVGPNMLDGNPIFHASRNNIGTAAFDATNWETAATECAKQTRFLNNRKLGIMPKYCLVPIDLWYTARKVFGYGDGTPTTYNPFAFQYNEEDPRPVPLAVPDFTDANDWAYMVDPRFQKTICMTYSAAPQGNRHPMPQLAVLTSGDYTFFNDKVMAVRVNDEAALGVATAVGMGKRNVA